MFFTLGKSSPTLPSQFKPIVWLDGSRTDTITEVSGFVSEWRDLSGNGNHFTQTNGANRPQTGVDLINGLNTLTFSAGTFLTGGSFSYDWGGEDFTIIVVAKANAGSDDYRGIIGNRFGTGSGNWFTIGELGTNGNIVVETGVSLQYFDSGIDKKGGGVFSLDFIKSGSVGEAFLDNSSFSTQSIPSGNLGDGTNEVRIGEWLTLTQCWLGQIAEVIIYPSAITTNLRLAIKQYSRSKWGVA